MGKHDPKLFFTPITMAVWFGNIEEVKALIEKENSVNEVIKLYDDGSSDHSLTLNVVFDPGDRKFKLKTEEAKTGTLNITPLMVAAFKDNLEIVKLLVESGASRFKEDKTSKTALSYAAMSGSSRCVEYLLKGYKMAYTHEYVAVNCAAMCGNLDAVKLLIDQAFNSRLKPETRLSGALALAKMHKQDKVVSYLEQRIAPAAVIC